MYQVWGTYVVDLQLIGLRTIDLTHIQHHQQLQDSLRQKGADIVECSRTSSLYALMNFFVSNILEYTSHSNINSPSFLHFNLSYF